MVEKRLKLEPEVQEIFNFIDQKENFLLSGGAGSGKTFSLVQIIKQVIEENPTSKVACITYTNAAVKEIEDRVNHKNLKVTTIHDFLWDQIKHFQKELKSTLISLINNEEVTKINIDNLKPLANSYFDHIKEGIQYKEFVKLREGIISHNELLVVAHQLFEKHTKLCDIVKDKYNFIFLDEYQDTNKLVVEILLKHFKNSKKQNIIGFFGDSMQSIYDDSIGNLNEFKGDQPGMVKEIKKEQNRRNPKNIINLANRLRNDGIIQVPSKDKEAPNMLNGKVKEGKLIFIYSVNGSIDHIKQFLNTNHGWDFSNSKQTKELNLTHNLIAEKAGFKNLMEIYDNDPIIGLKNEIIKKLKEAKQANKTEIEINDSDTFEQVLDKFQLKNRQKQLKKDILLQDANNVHLFNQLKDKLFSEVKKIYLDKDLLIDDKKQDANSESKKGSKRDKLIQHLFKIQNNIFLYQSGNFNNFLRATDYNKNIISIKEKRTLKDNIEALINVGNKTIEEVIDDANEKKICLIDDNLINFKVKNTYQYNRIKSVKFSEFQNLYKYLEGKTPFSTQHKTKGTEFNNVLVILNNGGWSNYNFENLFLNSGSGRVIERTQKIFYVCCTRAKENLAVFYHNPKPQVISKAMEWFGNECVIEL